MRALGQAEQPRGVLTHDESDLIVGQRFDLLEEVHGGGDAFGVRPVRAEEHVLGTDQADESGYVVLEEGRNPHVLLEDLPKFLTRCFSWAESGGLVVFIDNRFVPANSTPLYSTDEKGNTYQLRQLDDHSSHVVLKNFPTPDFLRKTLEPYARYVEVLEFDYYWIAICQAA